MHVKKGDMVKVIAGKEKGKTAIIVKALPSQDKVILEGLNLVKKNKKGGRGVKGTMVEVAMPIHVSNVKLADKAAKAPAVKKVTKAKAEKTETVEKPAAKKVAKKTAKKAE